MTITLATPIDPANINALEILIFGAAIAILCIGVPPNFDPLAMRDLVGFMVRVGLVVGRCFAAAGA
jgi:hypothetical protein